MQLICSWHWVLLICVYVEAFKHGNAEEAQDEDVDLSIYDALLATLSNHSEPVAQSTATFAALPSPTGPSSHFGNDSSIEWLVDDELNPIVVDLLPEKKSPYQSYWEDFDERDADWWPILGSAACAAEAYWFSDYDEANDERRNPVHADDAAGPSEPKVGTKRTHLENNLTDEDVSPAKRVRISLLTENVERCQHRKSDHQKCTVLQGSGSCDRCIEKGYGCSLHADPDLNSGSRRKFFNRAKCDCCRKAKQKCLPEARVRDGTPDSRCIRCKKYDLPCSAALVVGRLRLGSKSQSSVPATPTLSQCAPATVEIVSPQTSSPPGVNNPSRSIVIISPASDRDLLLILAPVILPHHDESQLKPHACNICSRSFARRGDLRKHLKYHTKPVICPIDECNAAFGTTKDLQRHLQGPHRASTEQHFCPHDACRALGRSFSRKDNLLRHLGEKHPGAVLDVDDVDWDIIKGMARMGRDNEI